MGRQRQAWLIPIADECVGVHVKLCNPLRTRAIPERFCGGDSLRRGAISSVCTFTLQPYSKDRAVISYGNVYGWVAGWLSVTLRHSGIVPVPYSKDRAYAKRHAVIRKKIIKCIQVHPLYKDINYS